jgi:hypothetical protein
MDFVEVDDGSDGEHGETAPTTRHLAGMGAVPLRPRAEKAEVGIPEGAHKGFANLLLADLMRNLASFRD